jgi:two-component system NarL family sensor kinase
MDSTEGKIFAAVIIAALVIGSIIGYFVYSLITYHRRMLLLQRRYATAEVTVLEKDRERIATDIHDEIAPMLVAVKMRVNSFDLDNESDCHQLEKTNTIIDEISKKLRAVSYDLMPSSLKMKGITTALDEFIGHLSGKNSLQIRFVPPGRPLHLSDQQTIHLYRITQELVHNAVKHANATELIIILKAENERVFLAIEDNGRGFDYEHEINQSTGLGLKSLLNRISLLHGKHTFDSQPGKGTSVLIEIPYHNDTALR